jgi:DNA-binding PadR family transcriptional regulator
MDILHLLNRRHHRHTGRDSGMPCDDFRHAGGHHHRRGGGGGWHGASRDGFDNDGEGFRRGRTFRSDDLQLLLLTLIEQQPRHGYELIKALDTLSNGFYSPSPGMVYPALTYLEELAYVTVELEGNRKRYSLAEAGKAYLAGQRERAELLFAKLTHIARKMDLFRQAVAQDGDGGWLAELIEARRELKETLLAADRASPAEQSRIAAILRRASEEIRGGAKR